MLKSRTSGDAVAAMLVLFEASFQFWLSSIRIPGASNGKADDLSRDRLANFEVLNPGADKLPTYIPSPLLQWLLCPQQD